MESDSLIKVPKTTVNNDNPDCGDKKVRCKTLIIHGVKYRTTFTQKYENRKKWVKPNENHIVSFIPGTIDQLFVEEGQSVKKGDTLLILEAMKMLNTIAAPHTGVIKKVNIEIGKRIPKGFLLIEFK